jgi:hypothetical protein
MLTQTGQGNVPYLLAGQGPGLVARRKTDERPFNLLVSPADGMLRAISEPGSRRFCERPSSKGHEQVRLGALGTLGDMGGNDSV